jgi:hypothetical protein
MGTYGLRTSISVVIHTWIRQSHGLGQTLVVGVVITDVPVYIREFVLEGFRVYYE